MKYWNYNTYTTDKLVGTIHRGFDFKKAGYSYGLHFFIDLYVNRYYDRFQSQMPSRKMIEMILVHRSKGETYAKIGRRVGRTGALVRVHLFKHGKKFMDFMEKITGEYQ